MEQNVEKKLSDQALQIISTRLNEATTILNGVVETLTI